MTRAMSEPTKKAKPTPPRPAKLPDGAAETLCVVADLLAFDPLGRMPSIRRIICGIGTVVPGRGIAISTCCKHMENIRSTGCLDDSDNLTVIGEVTVKAWRKGTNRKR